MLQSYMQLSEIQAAIGTLKSYLELGPISHQIELGIKGHIVTDLHTFRVVPPSWGAERIFGWER